MNWLKVNEHLSSYIYPVVKIISLIIIICLVFCGIRTCTVNSSSLNFIIRFFAVLVLILSVLGIYIAIGELIIVSDKRAYQKNASMISTCVEYRIENILCMAEQNDIIEITIVYEGKKVLVGSSSELENGSSEFRNKLYFIAETEYKTIADFHHALLPYSKDGMLIVYSIDGKAPERQ